MRVVVTNISPNPLPPLPSRQAEMLGTKQSTTLGDNMEQPSAHAMRLDRLLRGDRLAWMNNTDEGLAATGDPATIHHVINAYTAGWLDAASRTSPHLHSSERI